MGLRNLGTALAVAIAVAIAASTGAAAQLKVGFVYVGPIGDHGPCTNQLRSSIAT